MARHLTHILRPEKNKSHQTKRQTLHQTTTTDNFKQTICQTKTRVKVQETKSVWKLLQSMESASCLPLFPPAAEVKTSPLRVETFPGSRRPSGRCVLIRCLFGMCCTRNCCFFFLMFFCCLHLILEVNIQERKKGEYIFLFEADNC